MEPRKPELDPKLGIPVDVDRRGEPRNRLVTIGDSISHGFMSGAIFRTDLSWPAIVAFELGCFDAFRRPVYEQPNGPGGIPLDIERALRSFDAKFGSGADFWEYVSDRALAQPLPGRGGGLLGAGPGRDDPDVPRDPPQPRDLRLGPPRHPRAHGNQRPRPDPARAGRRTGPGSSSSRATTTEPPSTCSNRARSRQPRLTPLGAARVLGAQGTDESAGGPGIETLVVMLGSNNALQAVTNLEVKWSGADYDDVAQKGKYTVWRPEHFAAEWAALVVELRKIKARHVIVATVPAVTIAPIARGVGQKVRQGSRYFPYYTRPWIPNDEFDPTTTRTSPRTRHARSTRQSTPTTRRSSSR